MVWFINAFMEVDYFAEEEAMMEEIMLLGKADNIFSTEAEAIEVLNKVRGVLEAHASKKAEEKQDDGANRE